MLPTMAARQQQGLLVLANPPARPSASTLRHADIKSHRLLVLRSEHDETLLQACHNSLASGMVSTLIVWLPQMDDQVALRRLHLAAVRNHCLLVAIRPLDQAERPSPAILRLRLRMQPPEHLAVDVVKQPDGWGGQRVNLALPSTRPNQSQATHHSLPVAVQPLTRSDYSDPDSRFAWRRPVQTPAGLQHLPF
jgi:cell division inhibitor SulA/protein ImuA